MHTVHLCVLVILARFGDKQGEAYPLHARPPLHIAILSAAKHNTKRKACRDTWLRNLPAGVTASFMILPAADPAVAERLYNESVAHRDIHFVRGKEGYYEITHSTMSAVVSLRQRARYIMKCDDDTYVRVEMILERLRRGTPQYWLWATVGRGVKPQRSGKWGLTLDEYPGKTYPPFPHGPGYVLSADLVHWLAAHQPKVHIKLEDVNMGVWVNSAVKAGVPVKIEDGSFPTGCSEKYLISHYTSPAQMHCLARREKKCC